MRTINNTKRLTLGFFENAPARCSDLILLSVVIAENFFGLVDAAAINIAGVLNINLLWQVLLLVLSVVLYWKSLRVPGTKTSVWQGFFFRRAHRVVFHFLLSMRAPHRAAFRAGAYPPKVLYDLSALGDSTEKAL